jgi:hypothetical protein
MSFAPLKAAIGNRARQRLGLDRICIGNDTAAALLLKMMAHTPKTLLIPAQAAT